MKRIKVELGRMEINNNGFDKNGPIGSNELHSHEEIDIESGIKAAV